MKTLGETLEFCQEKSLSSPQAYSQLKQYILTNSSSKTVYLLEVGYKNFFAL